MHPSDGKAPRHVTVLVLGDVGRSPRMQYHALSLAQAGRVVHLVGYAGERCVPAVEASSSITQVLMTPDLLPRPRARALYLVYAPLKALVQMVQLLWTLLVLVPKAEVLLLQTPPAIPTLAAAWAVRVARGSTVVVDWHNLGFSVLEHGLRPGHPFVRLSRVYERIFGWLLDGHLCVTAAMAAWLKTEWGLQARVLHDRPPTFFRRLDLAERHALLRKLCPQFVDASGAALWPAQVDAAGRSATASASPWAEGGTPWTSVAANGAPAERPARPALLVSSTSWTADEDFGLLLDALATLDDTLSAGGGSGGGGGGLAWWDAGPQVVAVITGKGPQKAMYEERMRRLSLRRVAICTMWLEPADYPSLLGSADLGVCLHTSTSGLDLPMKVLDMFGCGLPVCAVGFACLGELLTHGRNGLVFDSSAQLAAQLQQLLAPTAGAAASLQRLKEGVAAEEAERPRWAANWRSAAGPLLLHVEKPWRSDAASIAAIALAVVLVLGVVLPMALAGMGSMETEADGVEAELAHEPASAWLPMVDTSPAPPSELINELPTASLFSDRLRRPPKRKQRSPEAEPPLRHIAPAASRKRPATSASAFDAAKKRAAVEVPAPAADAAKKGKTPITAGSSKQRSILPLTPGRAFSKYAGKDADTILNLADDKVAGQLMRDGSSFCDAYAAALNMERGVFIKLIQRSLAEHYGAIGLEWLDEMGRDKREFGF